MTDKPKRPKTRPTGFPIDPAKVVKVTPPPAVEVDRILAWRVKACYTQERGRWESFRSGATVAYRPPKAYDGRRPVTVDGELEVVPARASVWQALVDWCQRQEINPEEYVRISFAALPMTTSAPEPDQLKSAKYRNKWAELSGNIEEILRQKLASEKTTAAQNFVLRRRVYRETHAFALWCVLTDASLELSPLFRYCVAVDTNTAKTREIAQTFFAEAVIQFECYRAAYQTAWAAVLPKEFATQAKRAYPFVLSRLGFGSAERS